VFHYIYKPVCLIVLFADHDKTHTSTPLTVPLRSMRVTSSQRVKGYEIHEVHTALHRTWPFLLLMTRGTSLDYFFE